MKKFSLLFLVLLLTANNCIAMNFANSTGSELTNDNLTYHLKNAVSTGDTRKASNLLASGANVNAQDRYGCSLLHLATRHKNVFIISLLLTNGADIDAQNSYGNTALHWAVKQDNIFIVDLLVRSGANITIPNNSGKTALDIARESENTDLINFLLYSLAIPIPVLEELPANTCCIIT